jgi:hypothetical protein
MSCLEQEETEITGSVAEFGGDVRDISGFLLFKNPQSAIRNPQSSHSSTFGWIAGGADGRLRETDDNLVET